MYNGTGFLKTTSIKPNWNFMGFHQTAENLIGIGKILTISVIEMLFRIVATDNL